MVDGGLSLRLLRRRLDGLHRSRIRSHLRENFGSLSNEASLQTAE
jgi:hypothetical protein